MRVSVIHLDVDVKVTMSYKENQSQLTNEMQHVGLNWKFKLCPSCLLT